MCGIAGFIDPGGYRAPDERERIARAMADAVRHRGPDGTGTWSDRDSGASFGHTRLAIIDLGPTGAQPMHSASGRYVLVFNGEIYNHPDLRDELIHRGRRFRGRSDTEVLLEAIEEWGPVPVLDRLNGMFAFAVWDRREKRLTLARDRLGIKPLFHGRAGHAFVFGSELRCLKAHPDFEPRIDRQALRLYFLRGFVPSPGSIYEGVQKLPPGTWLQIDATGRLDGPTAYWSLSDIARRGLEAPFEGDEEEATDALDALLKTSLREHRIADVPMGALLSGGIDSSTVVALMAETSETPMRTFTIGFDEGDHDESEHAAKIAHHLGTEHLTIRISPDDALAAIPEVAALYDEPIADAPQIPTYLLAGATRRHVTACLSGDGGDELFGGYDRYRWTAEIERYARRMPGPMRHAVAGMIRPLSSRLGRDQRVRKLADVIAAESSAEAYSRVISHWSEPGPVLSRGGSIPPVELREHLDRHLAGAGAQGHTRAMMLLDTATYLPDQLLTRLDRATMAFGLEARVPLLDHRIVEFAWTLPQALQIRDGSSKYLLRRLLYRYVPRELVDRPKMGLSIPVSEWLRGPLREWAEDLLDPGTIRNQGYLDSERIRALWAEHLRARVDHSYRLWPVLVFQAWLESGGDRAR